MKVTMYKVLLDIMTESDGKSYDVTRLLLVAAVLVFLGLSIANWHSFNPTEYGLGIGGLIFGGAGAIGTRAVMEKKADAQ